jgi:hypothetical protein
MYHFSNIYINRRGTSLYDINGVKKDLMVLPIDTNLNQCGYTNVHYNYIIIVILTVTFTILSSI